jgi:hypothetical protein
MATLISELRARTNSGATDYSVNGVSYFTDDQLQQILDRRVLLTRMYPLVPVPIRIGTNTQWFDYQVDPKLGPWFERETGDGTSGWAIKDGYGAVQTLGTTYTMNWDQSLVTFAANTNGYPYLVDCRTYGMNGATADVWRQKAALEAQSIDFKSDNHDIKASQRREYCLQMVEYYEKLQDVSGSGGVQTASFARTDENLQVARFGQPVNDVLAQFPNQTGGPASWTGY